MSRREGNGMGEGRENWNLHSSSGEFSWETRLSVNSSSDRETQLLANTRQLGASRSRRGAVADFTVSAHASVDPCGLPYSLWTHEIQRGERDDKLRIHPPPLPPSPAPRPPSASLDASRMLFKLVAFASAASAAFTMVNFTYFVSRNCILCSRAPRPASRARLRVATPPSTRGVHVHACGRRDLTACQTRTRRGLPLSSNPLYSSFNTAGKRGLLWRWRPHGVRPAQPLLPGSPGDVRPCPALRQQRDGLLLPPQQPVQWCG